MSNQPAIVVEGLSKRFMIGEARSSTLREAVTMRIRQAFNGDVLPPGKEYWALRDVSFSIDQGEMVGIVGNNGAGKSTLLKILSRITPPTVGTASFRGRIGSLLEVGTGFHPELTGRDNVYLNGIILGMSRNDVRRRFDEIVEFAEIGDFIDTPVKRYSSGMYLRLAFAVAAHLDADILLVDEVLAVGDIAFQRKCMARMGEVTKGGRTVLFVSHNLTAVQSLCDRVILMSNGQVAADGPTSTILSHYLRTSEGTAGMSRVSWPKGEGPAGGSMELRDIRVRPTEGSVGDPIDVKTHFVVEFDIDHLGSPRPVAIDLRLVNAQDQLVFSSGLYGELQPWGEGTHKLRCLIPGDLLNDGLYRVTLLVNEGGELVLEAPHVLTLDVLDSHADRYGWYGKWDGVIRPRFDWTHCKPD